MDVDADLRPVHGLDQVPGVSPSFSFSTTSKRQIRASQAQPPAVPSFAAFRAKTSSVPGHTPVRRKPVPSTASASDSSRSPSLDISTLPEPRRRDDAQDLRATNDAQQSYIGELSHQTSNPWPDPKEAASLHHSDAHAPAIHRPGHSLVQQEQYHSRPADQAQLSTVLSRPQYDRATSSYHTAQASVSDADSDRLHGNKNIDLHSAALGPVTPQGQLIIEPTGDYFHEKKSSTGSGSGAAKQQRSPVQKITSLFTWKSSGKLPENDSPSTVFSDRSPSSSISSSSSRYTEEGMPHPLQASHQAIDTQKANASAHMYHYAGQPTPPPSRPTAMFSHAEELERELREVSVELANSVRREMELEDELDRWKLDNAGTTENGRRTSDYYSDSGASSVRHPLGDGEYKIEELERLRRKAEQEKAQMKVEMADRVNDGLTQQRKLEARIESLEAQLQAQQTQYGGSSEDGRNVRQLEATIEDVRRRLTEEKQFKENFEDLLQALRQDLELHRNERDNLRDEVVPELQARVEGLEAEAATMQTLAYDNARMQQELQTLREENRALRHGKMDARESQRQSQLGFSSIAEEEGTVQQERSPRVGLSRSNSLARGSALNGNKISLSRSNSVRDRPEPREPFSDRLADVEEQRDALHRALKSLLERQEYQAKEYSKKLRALELERDRLATSTPRRTAFHQEVEHLRSEVNHLRRRADEALEQKWQCEKGLSGLKMDLDRAQMETTSLRELLQERDIFVPERKGSMTEDLQQDSSTHVSLDRALQELRATHALSWAQIQHMGAKGTVDGDGANAEDALALLKQSITDAETERDFAQKEAESYRQQARELQQSELAHLSKEKHLAAQLHASAARMDELAAQVKEQLQSNKNLRTKLAEAISRGEREQKSSAVRIVEMQSKLRTLEDKVMTAQQHTEQVIHSQEAEVQQLKESQSAQLRRSRSGFLTSAKLAPTTPKSPLFTAKSPRLDKTSSGVGMSMAEASRAEILETKVKDLEKALSDAESEMQEVVGRMNMAQMEVAELQSQRDEAMRQTRRLQNEILEEREKVKAIMS